MINQENRRSHRVLLGAGPKQQHAKQSNANTTLSRLHAMTHSDTLKALCVKYPCYPWLKRSLYRSASLRKARQASEPPQAKTLAPCFTLIPKSVALQKTHCKSRKLPQIG